MFCFHHFHSTGGDWRPSVVADWFHCASQTPSRSSVSVFINKCVSARVGDLPTILIGDPDMIPVFRGRIIARCELPERLAKFLVSTNKRPLFTIPPPLLYSNPIKHNL
jgi:hypothetical protein